MNILNVQISDSEIKQYDLKSKKITMEELVKKINLQIARKSLKEIGKISKKAGLNKMTMKEINAEVKAARNAKKSRN